MTVWAQAMREQCSEKGALHLTVNALTVKASSLIDADRKCEVLVGAVGGRAAFAIAEVLLDDHQSERERERVND